MIKNAHKTPKEQIIELHTGISIEQWEENNRKLDQIMKEKQEQKKKQMQEANDQIWPDVYEVKEDGSVSFKLQGDNE